MEQAPRKSQKALQKTELTARAGGNVLAGISLSGCNFSGDGYCCETDPAYSVGQVAGLLPGGYKYQQGGGALVRGSVGGSERSWGPAHKSVYHGGLPLRHEGEGRVLCPDL